MKHIHTFESFLNEADTKDPKLVKGVDITVEMDDEDGDFVAGDYRVTGLTRGGVMLDGMGKRNLQVTFGALSDAGYTVNESAGHEIIFSVDDDKLDNMLNSRFSSQLDYQDIKGDSFYSLPKRDFDRFIDMADSAGFDVDYENSEDSVVFVQESAITESAVNEGVSSEAVYINVITGSGQQAIQDFIDENGIDVKKLVDYAKEVKGTADQYKLRDMISGTGLGSNEKMRNNFIKKMQ